MKRVFAKIQAVFLAIMILIVSNSYAITSHFCGTTLVDVSYFGTSTVCDMIHLDDECNDDEEIKKDCCKDVVEIIEPEVLDKTALFKFNTKELKTVIYFAVSYINSFHELVVEKEIFNDLPPPEIDSDILALHQRYLI